MGLSKSQHELSKSIAALEQRLSGRALPQRDSQSAHTSTADPDLFKLDLFEKYNPNQARDARGRFASGGGGGGGRRASALGGTTTNPFLQPSNSPAWWPTMARDLTAIGLIATGLGVAPVIALAGRGFSRTMLRGLGPVAYRMAQRYGGNVVSVFHTLARSMGFKIPKGALRGVPRAQTARAWSNMPKSAKAAVDRAVNKIPRSKIEDIVKPKRPR